MFSRYGDPDAKVCSGVITKVPDGDSSGYLQAAFRVDGSVNDVVFPGVSGTGLVTGQGEFAGSTVGHPGQGVQDFVTVTERTAASYGFAESEVGRNVVVANFASVSLVQKLLD